MASWIKVRKPNKIHSSFILPFKDVLLSLCTWVRNKFVGGVFLHLLWPSPLLSLAVTEPLASCLPPYLPTSVWGPPLRLARFLAFPLHVVPYCHSVALHFLPSTLQPHQSQVSKILYSHFHSQMFTGCSQFPS